MNGDTDMLQRIVEALDLEPVVCAEGRRDDLEIKDSIELELGRTVGTDAAKIGVSVENGVVTLNGRVRGISEKWAATRTVERVEGVQALVNGIEVRAPSILRRDDEDLSRAAAEALEWLESLPIGGVKVLVENGWITLVGEVQTWYEGWIAEHTVSQIQGVRGVSNNLTIKSPQPSNIQDALKQRSVDPLEYWSD